MASLAAFCYVRGRRSLDLPFNRSDLGTVLYALFLATVLAVYAAHRTRATLTGRSAAARYVISHGGGLLLLGCFAVLIMTLAGAGPAQVPVSLGPEEARLLTWPLSRKQLLREAFWGALRIRSYLAGTFAALVFAVSYLSFDATPAGSLLGFVVVGSLAFAQLGVSVLTQTLRAGAWQFFYRVRRRVAPLAVGGILFATIIGAGGNSGVRSFGDTLVRDSPAGGVGSRTGWLSALPLEVTAVAVAVFAVLGGFSSLGRIPVERLTAGARYRSNRNTALAVGATSDLYVLNRLAARQARAGRAARLPRWLRDRGDGLLTKAVVQTRNGSPVATLVRTALAAGFATVCTNPHSWGLTEATGLLTFCSGLLLVLAARGSADPVRLDLMTAPSLKHWPNGARRSVLRGLAVGLILALPAAALALATKLLFAPGGVAAIDVSVALSAALLVPLCGTIDAGSQRYGAPAGRRLQGFWIPPAVVYLLKILAPHGFSATTGAALGVTLLLGLWALTLASGEVSARG